MKKLVIALLMCLFFAYSSFADSSKEYLLYKYAEDANIPVERITYKHQVITLIHRRSSTFYMGSPLVFTLASFIDPDKRTLSNQAIVWYSKNYGEPVKLLINSDNNNIIEVGVNDFALGKQQTKDERIARDIPKFFLFGVFGMLGNPNYRIYKCKFDFDKTNLVFKEVNSIYLYTKDGFYIPLFVKYKNKNRYFEAKEAIEKAFYEFNHLYDVIEDFYK